MMLQLLETFMELLLWNSFQCHCHIFLDVFNILKSSSLYGRPYFWKQTEVIQSQIRGTGWVFHFSNRFLGQKLFNKELLVSYSTVMVENPISGESNQWTKVQASFYAQLQTISSLFPYNKLS
jgi:hypothetical protein